MRRPPVSFGNTVSLAASTPTSSSSLRSPLHLVPSAAAADLGSVPPIWHHQHRKWPPPRRSTTLTSQSENRLGRNRHLPFILAKQHKRTFLTALTLLLFSRASSPHATEAETAATDNGDNSHARDNPNPQTAAEDARVALASAGFDRSSPHLPRLPFRFDTGTALFAKRAPRPFPPPFLSPPSGSFSDPLSTHDRSRDLRAGNRGGPRRKNGAVIDGDGRLIQGCTNGDDAVFASDYFIGVDDGVGAWSARPRGHAGLWARLVLHYWATAILENATRLGADYSPDPVACLQRAYDQAIQATSAPNDWQGTTTATGALLHYRNPSTSTKDGSRLKDTTPLLYVTNLGDSQVMVVRPSRHALIFKSDEQWHWFDCPRQLGTNSPDTPLQNAVVTTVDIEEGDIVLAMSDGVIDNLWSHEIVTSVCESLERWEVGGPAIRYRQPGTSQEVGAMMFVADELMERARRVALDPFAESPFMEHAIDEGLASEGGKLDDISVVAARCRRNENA